MGRVADEPASNFKGGPTRRMLCNDDNGCKIYDLLNMMASDKNSRSLSSQPNVATAGLLEQNQVALAKDDDEAPLEGRFPVQTAREVLPGKGVQQGDELKLQHVLATPTLEETRRTGVQLTRLQKHEKSSGTF